MIKIEKTEVVGFEPAIRGMRNPMNSWDKSDTTFVADGEYHDIAGNSGPFNGTVTDTETFFIMGFNDLKLMTQLRNAGTDHRKFMRMITVYVDITAPLYWWKEFDTYKVGTVANSCSTMHKIADKELTLDDFSHEHLMESAISVLEALLVGLNISREYFRLTKNEKYWWQMIQLLPASYNQKRTIMLNYEVLANMYTSRKNHKLDEWRDFCAWIESLPYSELITGRQYEKYSEYANMPIYESSKEKETEQ